MLIALTVVFLNVALVMFPSVALGSARFGLGLWLDNVLPALLPFAVGVNILHGLGFTRFLGVLLEPLMYPLFRVPGSGGFALVTGMVSGTPLGAKVAADLRTDGLLTREEARRLSAFSNCSGPLFIIGAVGAGTFGSPAAGYFLYIVHILGAFIVAFIFRWYGTDKREDGTPRRRILTKAVTEMEYGRSKSGSFGQILGTSVVGAMETMLIVGGFIMLFNVIIGILTEVGAFRLAAAVLPDWLAHGGLAGLLEVTAGVKGLGNGRTALIAAAGIISWGGLSIHAQSIGYLSKTDIGAMPYIIGKALHSAASVGFAALLYPVFAGMGEDAVSAGFFGTPEDGGFMRHVFSTFRSSALLFVLSAGAMTVLGLFVYLAARTRKKRRH